MLGFALSIICSLVGQLAMIKLIPNMVNSFTHLKDKKHFPKLTSMCCFSCG